MSLKFEPEYNRIIYDHLSPETPSMTGFYSYYVPDFSYDAFVFYKSKWILQEAVVGVNKKSSVFFSLRYSTCPLRNIWLCAYFKIKYSFN